MQPQLEQRLSQKAVSRLRKALTQQLMLKQGQAQIQLQTRQRQQRLLPLPRWRHSLRARQAPQSGRQATLQHHRRYRRQCAPSGYLQQRCRRQEPLRLAPQVHPRRQQRCLRRNRAQRLLQ